IDVRQLRSGDQVEVQNWAAYCFKISTTRTSGLESDLATPLLDDLLPKYVHAYESIRGRGLNGVRLSYGLRNPDDILSGENDQGCDQSDDTVPSVVSVDDDPVHPTSTISFPN